MSVRASCGCVQRDTLNILCPECSEDFLADIDDILSSAMQSWSGGYYIVKKKKYHLIVNCFSGREGGDTKVNVELEGRKVASVTLEGC